MGVYVYRDDFVTAQSNLLDEFCFQVSLAKNILDHVIARWYGGTMVTVD